MKFLCGNCKAKYQIADEKIAGRTLRMKCRRCGHDIIIKGARGEAGTGSQPPVKQAGGKPASRSRPPRSTLGSDFRKQVQERQAPPPPPPPPSADQWHVAINDVPVGPIRKAEIHRKIQAGAVNGESLCWREGFDDWRPLKEVTELSTLLRQPPPAPPKPASLGRGIQRHGSRPRIRLGRSSVPAPTGASSRPSARSNVVPIGGRLGAAAAPAIEPEPDDLAGDPTRVSEPHFDQDSAAAAGSAEDSVKPVAVATAPAAIDDPFGSQDDLASSRQDDLALVPGGGGALHLDSALAPPPRRGLPVGAWIGIAGAGAFGITLAVIIGLRFVFPPEPVAVAPAAPSVPEPDMVIEPMPEEILDEVLVEEPVEEEAAPGEEDAAPSRPESSGAQARRPTPRMSDSHLSEEEQRRLQQAGLGGGGPNLTGLSMGFNTGSTGSRGGELSEAQIASVVSRNRPQLRRCYETAVRGNPEPPSIRVNISVQIAATGRVSSVRAQSSGSLPGLNECVQGTVRRWVFPRSGGATPLTFPVVFSGG